MRTLGLLLITMGLISVSLALSMEGGGEGVVIVFPFVIGNAGGWSAALFTALLFATFILTSILPWYMMSRKVRQGEGYVSFRRERPPRGGEAETLEYIITTELPRELMNSIYIDADEDEVYLKSTTDEGFSKKYSLPQGFEVGGFDYDYEEKYLVIKLMLKKIT